MKKILGYIFLIAGGLFFLGQLLALLSEYHNDRLIDYDYHINLIFGFINLAFVIIGLFLIKKSKSKTDFHPDNVFFDNSIELNFQLEFIEYFKGLIISLPLLKFIFILLPIIGFINLLSHWLSGEIVIENVGLFESLKEKIIFILLIFFPVLLFWVFKRQFNSNEQLRESIKYTFSNDLVKIEASNSNSTLGINDFYKIKITDKLIILFWSKYVINVIPKRVFESNESYLQFIKKIN